MNNPDKFFSVLLSFFVDKFKDYTLKISVGFLPTPSVAINTEVLFRTAGYYKL